MPSFRPLLRRWRPLAASAAVLVAAVAFILGYVQRDNLFRTLNDPGTPFQVWEPPAAPDYGEAESWARLPELPEEELEQDQQPTPAVFFIHPTTYNGGGNWNAPIDKASVMRRVDRIMVPNYAEPFSAAGPVFAPRYRQGSLYTFMTNRDDARRARLFAYRDVERAFASFLQRIGPDRAFVLAGVDQGGLHAIGLLRDHIAPDEAMRQRLLAAYVIDYPLPLDLFQDQLSPLRPCRAEDDFRCVIGWTATRADDLRRIRYLTERLMVWDTEAPLAPIGGRTPLCMNPLLWARSEDFAPARLNKGAVAAEGLDPGVRPSPAPGQTSAQCQDGLLIVDRPESGRFRKPRKLAERYRPSPFNLFYEDLRTNVAARAEAGIERLNDAARFAEPLEEVVILGDAPINRVPD